MEEGIDTLQAFKDWLTLNSPKEAGNISGQLVGAKTTPPPGGETLPEMFINTLGSRVKQATGELGSVYNKLTEPPYITPYEANMYEQYMPGMMLPRGQESVSSPTSEPFQKTGSEMVEILTGKPESAYLEEALKKIAAGAGVEKAPPQDVKEGPGGTGAISSSLGVKPLEETTGPIDQPTYRAGLGTPTKPPTPEPELAGPPKVAPAVPTEASMGLVPASTWENKLNEIMATMPQTRAAALQSVGRDAREFQMAKKPLGLQIAEAFAAGAAGVNPEAIREKEQARLAQIENQEIQFAMTKLNRQDQFELRKLQMQKAEDDTKRDNLGKVAAYRLQNLPPDFGKRPGDAEMMAQIQAQLGASWRLPEDYVKGVLDKAWNPTKGQYDNLYLNPVERWKLEVKAKADSIAEIFPGYPQEVYTTMAATGKWPEWADDTIALMQKQMATAMRTNDMKTYDELALKMSKIQRQKLLYSVQNIQELFNSPFLKNALPPGSSAAAIADSIMKIYGFNTPEFTKGILDMNKTNLEGQYKVAATRASATGFAPGDPKKIAEDRAAQNLTWATMLFPNESVGFTSNPLFLQTKINMVEAANENWRNGRATPGEIALVKKAMQAMYATMYNMDPNIAKMPAPTTWDEMKDLQNQVIAQKYSAAERAGYKQTGGK